MVEFGYSLLCEQAGPKQLVSDAILAEASGFDFASVSDHFYPWLDEQGHSPNAWAVLGAMSQMTERIKLMTMVTCPIRRYHPTVVAQQAATVALLSDGRFTLAVGAGENLNEHVVGDWPQHGQRHEMLTEALEIMRPLLHGEKVKFAGTYFDVPEAQLYDVPADGVPLAVAVSGRSTADIAAEFGDAMVTNLPEGRLAHYFDEAGGTGKPRYGQVVLCYGPDEAACQKLAHDQFRANILGWPVMSELPTPKAFDTASQFVRPEDMTKTIPCGPDLDQHAAAVRQYVDAGFTHIGIAQIGGAEQDRFLTWAQNELLPALRS